MASRVEGRERPFYSSFCRAKDTEERRDRLQNEHICSPSLSKGLIPRIEKPQRLHIRPDLVVPACKCWCLEVLGKKVVGLRKALAIE